MSLTGSLGDLLMKHYAGLPGPPACQGGGVSCGPFGVLRCRMVAAMVGHSVRGDAWRSGFTLIELLVVLSVIALLIGILLPALVAARDAETKVACAANMRQIAAGIYMFAADHDDELVRGPELDHGYLAPFGVLYSNTADSQVWVGEGEVFTGLGVLHDGYLEEPLALFCSGDDTTDPQSELDNIGAPHEDAYGSYLYRNLDQVNGGTRLSALGANDGGLPAEVLALDRQTQIQAIPNAYRTNHHNTLSNLLFTDGHVELFDNSRGENLLALRGNNRDYMVLPFRLDEILQNADHAGSDRGSPYPFP